MVLPLLPLRRKLPPLLTDPKNLGYDNLFRVLIVQFIDALTFDLRSIKETRLKPVRDQTLA